jgi:hypothetical protein
MSLREICQTFGFYYQLCVCVCVCVCVRARARACDFSFHSFIEKKFGLLDTCMHTCVCVCVSLSLLPKPPQLLNYLTGLRTILY